MANQPSEVSQLLQAWGRGDVQARVTHLPPSPVQALDAQLSLDGDDESSAEARALDVRISCELPNERIRQCFTESEVVQRVRRLSSA